MPCFQSFSFAFCTLSLKPIIALVVTVEATSTKLSVGIAGIDAISGFIDDSAHVHKLYIIVKYCIKGRAGLIFLDLSIFLAAAKATKPNS